MAAETLDALQSILRDPSLDKSLSDLQATLQEAVTEEQICRIVDLGNIIEEIIVKPREKLSSNYHNEQTSVLANTCLFSQEEQTLWYGSVISSLLHCLSFILTLFVL